MTVAVVVQARMGSTRLPGKVLAPLGGMPMLAFQLARLAVDPPGPVIVATSTMSRDDPIVEVAEAAGTAVVRGDEADVLNRYLTALDEHGAEHVVRLTADCPLTDPALVAEAVDLHLRSEADYTSNVHPRSYPKGLDVEVVRATALRVAAEEATDPGEREHVTPFTVRRPRRFRLATLWSGDAALAREWWTVDRPEDLEDLRATIEGLDDPIGAPWRAVLAARGRRRGPGADELWLRPEPPPAPGSAPWTTTWEAVRGRSIEGQVRLAVDDGVGTVTYDTPSPASAVLALVNAAVADTVQVAVSPAGPR